MRKPRGHFWTNKKYGAKLKFQGSYVITRNDRAFQLTPVGSKRKPVTLESWQMARSAGWKML
jgi:hypothetical protein